ncbi:MAG: hypothetical protein NZ942_02080 [Candidatus Aenigmarchaeota archaeon]|nr:hypothetical protein [Candidatus Aenigmarchaeota archaeon]
MRKKFLFLIFFLLLIPNVKALSFGSLQKASYAEMEKGETKEFTILLWNLEESPIFINFNITSPESFIVLADPKEFYLNKSKIGPPYEEGEYVSISLGDVKAFPVKILIKALDSAKGENEIKVKVRAESLNSGIKLTQEKTFVFKVKILEHFSSEQTEETERTKEEVEEKKEITSRISLPSFNLRLILLALLVILILAVSFLIYKFL